MPNLSYSDLNHQIKCKNNLLLSEISNSPVIFNQVRWLNKIISA